MSEKKVKQARRQRALRWWRGWFWAEPLECWGGPVIWCVGLGFWTLAYWRGPYNERQWHITLNID